jgi:hypothetical protein
MTDVSLAPNGEIRLGPVTATIVAIADASEPGVQRVDLESKAPMEQIQGLVFTDGGGTEIPATLSGGSSFGDDIVFAKSVQLNAKAESIRKAKVTYFKKILAVKVAVDAKCGLNLEQ